MELAYLRPTRVEIDLDNLEYNFKKIRGMTNPRAKICAVLKGNAYGHGAVEVAKNLADYDISYLAVAFLDEALELRENGITKPILVLGYTPEEQFGKAVKHDITQTIFNVQSACILAREAQAQRKNTKIHIKLDTGMNRLGFLTDNTSLKEIKKLFALKWLTVEGIFTHFSKADEDDVAFTQEQFSRFNAAVSELEKGGCCLPVRHAANSAAILQFPFTHLDMVRAGIILYGLHPNCSSEGITELRPVMSLKTRVAHTKIIPEGSCISYGGRYVTRSESVIATLPIGYADGYPRNLSSRGYALVKGKRAPIAGTICMDQCMIDVTGIEGVKPGDEVVLFGRMGNEEITAKEIADLAGTVCDEIVTMITRRVPRVYLKSGRIACMRNFLLSGI